MISSVDTPVTPEHPDKIPIAIKELVNTAFIFKTFHPFLRDRFIVPVYNKIFDNNGRQVDYFVVGQQELLFLELTQLFSTGPLLLGLYPAIAEKNTKLLSSCHS